MNDMASFLRESGCQLTVLGVLDQQDSFFTCFFFDVYMLSLHQISPSLVL